MRAVTYRGSAARRAAADSSDSYDKPIDTASLAEQLAPLMPVPTEREELAARLADFLYGERGVVRLFARELITAQGAVQYVAARVETWLVERRCGGLDYGSWIADDFMAVLSRAFLAAHAA